MNVLECSNMHKVKKLLFACSGCVYPEKQNSVFLESDFGKHWVQEGTEPYGLAKAAGAKLCYYYNREYNTNFITAFLSNIYGVTDSNNQAALASVLLSLIPRDKEGEKMAHMKLFGVMIVQKGNFYMQVIAQEY